MNIIYELREDFVMKKFKRFLALLGVILLVLLYFSTLIFALMDSELATGLFKVSVAGTILIPILLYGILLFYRLLNQDDSDENES